MLKVLILIYFFFVLKQEVNAQRSNLILTNEQNKVWLDSLTNSSLENKLTIINNRLLNDTLVYVQKTYSDLLKGNYLKGSKIEGTGEPVLMIDGSYFIRENFSEPEQIIKLTKLLTSKHVKSIEILDNNKATALLGPIGSNGLILIQSSTKKSSNKFRKVRI